MTTVQEIRRDLRENNRFQVLKFLSSQKSFFEILVHIAEDQKELSSFKENPTYQKNVLKLLSYLYLSSMSAQLKDRTDVVEILLNHVSDNLTDEAS